MPRATPPGRLEDLVDAAARVFIERGYRRTQMSDIAAALGVAKGTLYLHVESKEALFDLALRLADAPRPLEPLLHVPVSTPKPGETIRYVRQRLEENQGWPTLQDALTHKRVGDVRRELHAILGELYDVLARNRRGIKLLDRASVDHPELARLWFEGGRVGAMEALRRYLEDRIRRRKLRPSADLLVTARFVLESVTFWAVHRHWDPHPQAVEEDVARETILQLIADALVADALVKE